MSFRKLREQLRCLRDKLDIANRALEVQENRIEEKDTLIYEYKKEIKDRNNQLDITEDLLKVVIDENKNLFKYQIMYYCSLALNFGFVAYLIVKEVG